MTARGAVNARLEAVLTLRLRNPAGSEVELEAVVDTGFSGSLIIPAPLAASLDLARRSGGSAVLADGSSIRFDTFGAEVEWGGWRGVVVSAVGNEALVGMGLLAGSELRIEVAAGGAIEVQPLS